MCSMCDLVSWARRSYLSSQSVYVNTARSIHSSCGNTSFVHNLITLRSVCCDTLDKGLRYNF